MDPRRAPRAVIDPKVRKVGFFAPPERSQSGPPDPIPATSSSPPVSDISPAGNSLSPVMIPPPRHASESLLLHARPAPFPAACSPPGADSTAGGGSFNSSSDFFLAPMSPTPSSHSSRIVVRDEDFFDGAAESPRPGGGAKGTVAGKVASSFPRGGFDLTAMKASSVPASKLTTVSVVNASLGILGAPLWSTSFNANVLVKPGPLWPTCF